MWGIDFDKKKKKRSALYIYLHIVFHGPLSRTFPSASFNTYPLDEDGL